MTRVNSPRGSVKWAIAWESVPRKVSSCSLVSSRHTAMLRSPRASRASWRAARIRWGVSNATRVAGLAAIEASSLLRSAARRAQEAEVGERRRGYAGHGEGGCQRGRAGDDDDGRAGRRRLAGQLLAGIVDGGHPGVCYQGDVALTQGVQHGAQAGGATVLVVADGRGVDGVAGEQAASDAGVLGSDEADVAEDPEGAEGDVLEVAYWSADYVQRWHCDTSAEPQLRLRIVGYAGCFGQGRRLRPGRLTLAPGGTGGSMCLMLCQMSCFRLVP